MGSKQSKTEHKYIPGAPITQYGYVTRFNKNNITDSALDPRSPAECRTPFYLPNKDFDTNLHLNVEGTPEAQPNSQNILDALRRRLFKSFDPRSPNPNINRTPLIFDDTLEKSLHLDDTFADIFIEARLPKSLKEVYQCEGNIDSKCLENVGADGLEKYVTIDVEEQGETPKGHVVVQPKNRLLSANAHFDFDNKHETNCPNVLSARRKQLFNCFVYDITDPRSPNLNINRTPLVFDDNLEKSLCLDDTLEDLCIEPDQTKKRDQSRESKCVEVAEMDLEKQIKTFNIPIATQQVLDPRSPLRVERTPIIFADETNEDVMLESILENLKLNTNSMENNSMISMAKSDMKVDTNIDSQFVTKPWNKRLDTLLSGIEYSPKAKYNKPKRLRQSRQQIYEDNENEMPIAPKLKLSQSNKNNSLKGKRTPLGCVRNHSDTRGRSRSVESSKKSLKTRLALISIDDIGNPTENRKFPALRIVEQGTLASQDLMEL